VIRIRCIVFPLLFFFPLEAELSARTGDKRAQVECDTPLQKAAKQKWERLTVSSSRQGAALSSVMTPLSGVVLCPGLSYNKGERER
jgi:hypothetical protein